MFYRSHAFCLGLVTALSIGCILASSAWAKVAFSASPLARPQGKSLAKDVLTIAGIDIDCEVTFEGALRDPKTLELIPLFDRCSAKAFAGLPAKFVMSGCVYLVRPLESMDGGERWRATVEIECPPEYTLEWHVYETEGKFEDGSAMCTTGMLPQKNLGQAVLSNLKGPPRRIGIRWDLTGITYKAYGSSLFCGSVFGAMKHGASYRGAAIIEAETSQGKSANLAVSG